MTATGKDSIDQPLLIRTDIGNLWIGVCLAIWPLMALAYLIIGNPSISPDSRPGEADWNDLVLAYIAVSALLMFSLLQIWKWFHFRVSLGPKSICVSDMFKRTELHWSEIDSVVIDDYGRLELKGPRRIQLRPHRFTVASRRHIGEMICRHVSGQQGNVLLGWSIPLPHRPGILNLKVRDVLRIVWLTSLPGIALLLASLFGNIRLAGMGTIFSLFGAAIGSWTAIRLKNWKLAVSALIFWVTLGLEVWRALPLFQFH